MARNHSNITDRNKNTHIKHINYLSEGTHKAVRCLRSIFHSKSAQE